jgi:hypothetical protein
MNESNIMAYVSNLFTFTGQLIMSNSSSILTGFCQFFTWIALGDAELHFSFMLVRKASADE